MDKTRLFDRCLRFETDVLVNGSPVVEPWSCGRILFNPELPDMWYRNVALVESDTGRAAPADLVREIDDAFAARDARHRKLAGAEDLVSSDLAAHCVAAGWARETLVTMVYTPSEAPGPGDRDVEEISAEDYRAMTRAIAREIPDEGDRPEVVEQIVESAFRQAAEANARYFGVAEDGALVSGCHLYSDGVIAQVEDVGTLTAHRRKGLSNAVVRHAVRTALDAGHELVFLVADDEDWPKDFYGRIGFEEVGRSIQLLLKRQSR